MATRKVGMSPAHAAPYGQNAIPEGTVVLGAEGYAKLGDVFLRAFEQASSGKGRERHANNKPFEQQPMQTVNMEQGSIDGFLFQARKKSLEAKGLPYGRAQAELLGAMVYLAGAIIALESWAAHTLPAGEGEKG